MDNLARAAFMARQEGLTYGQYMAKHGANPFAKGKPVVLDGICPTCGAEVPKKQSGKGGRQRKFCSDDCCKLWHHRQKKG